MTARAGQLPLASAAGPGLWLWPVAAAILAAWPIWRSVAPETPDLGAGWTRLELVAGLALVLLYAVWACLRRMRGFEFPLWALALATGGVIISTRSGDQAAADLCILMIAWIAATGIFASLALAQIEAAGRAAGCAPAARQEMFAPIPGLRPAYAVAMAGITYLATRDPASVAIMGIVSPGAILAWAALSDTARSALGERRVHFADPAALLDVTRRRVWRFLSPAILLSDRPKLVNLYPAEGVRPGDLAALAAALTLEDESELGRAIQEFGVSHRIRLPVLKETNGAGAALRHAILPDGAEMALCELDQLAVDVTPFAEAIELARSLRRDILAVAELAPHPRMLGLIVFAVGSRTGAAGALQALRAQGRSTELSAPARDPRDEPPLNSLQIARAEGTGGSNDVVAVARAGQDVDAGTGGLLIRFGGGRAAPGQEPAIVAAREDARVLSDLARFAEDFRARAFIVTLLSNAPGWALIAAAFGYLPATPLLVTGVAVAGIVLAVGSAQVLRASPTLAKEVDEE